MLSSSMELHNQTKLKHELQKEPDASKLERLASALLSRLLDVPIAIASSGYQYGADAGTAGQQGRRFRLECKKYRDNSHPNERELLGEIDQALARDSALEAWILVATRSVPEQMQQSLTQHGEQSGVPVVIIDWIDDDIAPLAALCGFAPDLVEAEFANEAGAAARALQSISRDMIGRLQRNLESWCLGFESLRKRSHEKLDNIWNLPRESNSALGQNAAGGAQENRVKRRTVQEVLDKWWHGPAQSDAPAAVIGRVGTGKTWATLDWLIDNRTEQPIVLVTPSSAVTTMSVVSEASLKRFLADRLYEVSGVRDSEHWHRRLDYLLGRPSDEGPVLSIVFDGLNQEPSVEWLRLLKVLQAGSFAGRVRVIFSTRQHHYENRLSMLRGLVAPAVRVPVDQYDNTPGGELDQMLGYEGLVRADLHAEVLEMARTPRLFDLVVHFGEKLVEAGQVTIHRLLWEYGRDTLGVRAERSFSEQEWRDWLKEVAHQHRTGFRRFSTATLSQTVNRPDLTECEVYARLSDIIDGQFATHGSSGDLQLIPSVVSHALGAVLLHHLDQVASPTFDALDVELKQWLDPIAGFDEPSEVLRAAVSILVEQGRATSSPVSGVLLTAWLQSQNVLDAHRREIADLAPEFPDALLEAVEHSESHVHNSARLWAVNALRKIPRTDNAALVAIVARADRWMRCVFRDIGTRRNAHKEHDEWRSDQLRQRIGTDSAGSTVVVGRELELVDQDFGLIQAVVPSIIEGFSLANALPIFQAAAVVLAVADRSACWDGLRWLCLLNDVDPDHTAASLRELANEVGRRKPEPGVRADLPRRVAALLLWLTGLEVDEDAAASIDPRTDQPLTYERDYLPRPSRSAFPLERRHAELTLNDRELPILRRVERIGELWLDPDFLPPNGESFVADLRNVAARFDVDKLNDGRARAIEDHHFELLEPALARCAPELLASILRRKIRGLAMCSGESWYWKAIHAIEHSVLSGESEMTAAQAARRNGDESDENRNVYAITQLLLLEILNLDAKSQVDAVIGANLKYISTDISEVLRPLAAGDVDALIDRYKAGTDKQQNDLLTLLSNQPHALTDDAWSWIEKFVSVRERDDIRGLAFKTLAQADLGRFGRILWTDGWSWNPDDDLWVSHYGSVALVETALSISFDELVPRLAPWRLLEAVRRRGCDPAEIRLAAEIFGTVLASNEIEAPDPGSDLSVDLTKARNMPFSYSLELRRSQDEAENLRLAFDVDAQIQAVNRAIDTAASRIREARSSGVRLYLATFDSNDFVPVIQAVPDIVERWIEGCSEPTEEFRRRVRLAEGAFLALCEALLVHEPEQGSRLWRALRKTMMTRYLGEAEVEELLHMVFRAPGSPAVAKLREEIAELKHSHTDRALFDLSIAASYNNNGEWLHTIIREDRASPYAWRQIRATILEGFCTNNTLPIAMAWPDGKIKTERARNAQMSARSGWREACARHWWKVYLEARDPAEAYAAWVLFLRSADRRIWVWMQREVDAVCGSDDLFHRKISHVCLNRERMKRALKKQEEKSDRNFLYRRIVRDIGPWV